MASTSAYHRAALPPTGNVRHARLASVRRRDHHATGNTRAKSFVAERAARSGSRRSPIAVCSSNREMTHVGKPHGLLGS